MSPRRLAGRLLAATALTVSLSGCVALIAAAPTIITVLSDVATAASAASTIAGIAKGIAQVAEAGMADGAPLSVGIVEGQLARDEAVEERAPTVKHAESVILDAVVLMNATAGHVTAVPNGSPAATLARQGYDRPFVVDPPGD